MIQHSGVWPQPAAKEPVDTWKDSRVRSSLDRVAKFVESGAVGRFGPTSGGGESGDAAHGGGGGETAGGILEPVAE